VKFKKLVGGGLDADRQPDGAAGPCAALGYQDESVEAIVEFIASTATSSTRPPQADTTSVRLRDGEGPFKLWGTCG